MAREGGYQPQRDRRPQRYIKRQARPAMATWSRWLARNVCGVRASTRCRTRRWIAVACWRACRELSRAELALRGLAQRPTANERGVRARHLKADRRAGCRGCYRYFSPSLRGDAGVMYYASRRIGKSAKRCGVAAKGGGLLCRPRNCFVWRICEGLNGRETRGLAVVCLTSHEVGAGSQHLASGTAEKRSRCTPPAGSKSQRGKF